MKSNTEIVSLLLHIAMLHRMSTSGEVEHEHSMLNSLRYVQLLKTTLNVNRRLSKFETKLLIFFTYDR